MHPDYKLKPGERVMRFEPVMITEAEFKSAIAADLPLKISSKRI